MGEPIVDRYQDFGGNWVIVQSNATKTRLLTEARIRSSKVKQDKTIYWGTEQKSFKEVSSLQQRRAAMLRIEWQIEDQ